MLIRRQIRPRPKCVIRDVAKYVIVFIIVSLGDVFKDVVAVY
jgi:hypothetical protein